MHETYERTRRCLALAAPSQSRCKGVIASSFNTYFLARAINEALLQEGELPVIVESTYNNLYQQCLDEQSLLYSTQPQFVLLVPDWRLLVSQLPLGSDEEKVLELLDAHIARFEACWTRLQERHIIIIQHTLLRPPMRYCGIAEFTLSASPLRQVMYLNDEMLRRGRNRIAWIDMNSLSSEAGTKAFLSSRYSYYGKLSFSPHYLPEYSAAFRGAWRFAINRTKKLLIVDMDDTLWGGSIGEGGLEGIELGPDSARGEAFVAWQQYLKALRTRGVLLAACSKNDPRVANIVFKHPHVALLASDFCAIECSWNDKVTGIRAISAKVGIAMDAIVFADDSPFECGLVRDLLPEVEVVELGDNPELFIEHLERGHYFATQSFTPEDHTRHLSYKIETPPNSLSLGEYFTSLNMVGAFSPMTLQDLGRLAQLERRVNQFNLTTRRYSEQQLTNFLGGEHLALYGLRLVDRQADHGLVGSVVCIYKQDVLVIDSWLISCRVFSRTLEEFTMIQIASDASRRGVQRIRGLYRPSARNSMVSSLYARLGFRCIAEDASEWELELKCTPPWNTYIQCR
jgi:FkbH-like protein